MSILDRVREQAGKVAAKAGDAWEGTAEARNALADRAKELATQAQQTLGEGTSAIRSRFTQKVITPEEFATIVDEVDEANPDVDAEAVERILAMGYAAVNVAVATDEEGD